MDKLNDISIAFSKLDIPTTGGYVCLGHFDCAKIVVHADSESHKFYEFKDPEVLSATETSDPEGLQRNYLIHSGIAFGDSNLSGKPHFKFAMTISLKKQENFENIEEYVQKFKTRLSRKNEEKFNKKFYWQFYYPVARGDIILMLDTNSFDEATMALYHFVYNNPLILYSYTIPMISYDWLKEPALNASCAESKHCSMLLRATIRDYKGFFTFIGSIKFSWSSRSPKYYVSFGTEDVQVDFGPFCERALHVYLNKVISESEDGQDALRKAVYSAELAVPRKVATNKPKVEGKK